ncbi:hypothetical protein HNP40_003915 [Mycobacteroides chelonae]|nr:hypothetical protein [Mycobacteroides chelonae]
MTVEDVFRLGAPKWALALGKAYFRYVRRSNFLPSAVQQAAVDEFSTAEDTLSDDLVAAMARLPKGEGRAQFELALEQGISAVEDPMPELVALLADMESTPYWVDPVILERAQRAVSRSPLRSTVFTTAAVGLPFTYLSPHSNVILMLMGGLHEKAASRLLETVAWIYDAGQPGGLDRFGAGFKSSARIRVIHAYVRSGTASLSRQQGWAYDVPINLKAQAVTMNAFIIGSLAVMAVGNLFSIREANAILHMYRVMAHQMGIPTELQLSSFTEFARLFGAVIDTAGVDSYTRPLTQAMLNATPALTGTARFGPLARAAEKIVLTTQATFTRTMLGNTFGNNGGYPGKSAIGYLGWISFTCFNLVSAMANRLRYTGRPHQRFVENAARRRQEFANISKRIQIDKTYNREGSHGTIEENARKLGLITNDGTVVMPNVAVVTT